MTSVLATKKDDVMKVVDETAAAVAVAAEEKTDIDDALGAGSKRRFFPRVKHLLTREWESFLAGVLDAMDQAHAPSAAVASHKATNPWFKAFELVYDGVASDCSVPTGKNRFHKFKDKIVELWNAMEQEAPDDHPLKPRSMEQLNLYRQACEEQQKAELNDAKATGGKASMIKKSPLGGSAMKRPYSSTFHPTTGRMWKHLDEGSALQKLPEPLKSLTHLRHMATEIGASGAKQDIEVQYMAELYSYLGESTGEPFEKSQILTALYRLSQTPKEAKDVLAAYERAVQEYLIQMSPPNAKSAEV
ncbi:unnamed protein product [Cylindrotheca closterium]|uniref:Uncharacterized protein n=1 Tax=Cylindrotheca closterium TaxID=2856 RepID=A0AAD2FWF0_9STRA|nr:unnamed protein product [Cylindrotheca closterium]